MSFRPFLLVLPPGILGPRSRTRLSVLRVNVFDDDVVLHGQTSGVSLVHQSSPLGGSMVRSTRLSLGSSLPVPVDPSRIHPDVPYPLDVFVRTVWWDRRWRRRGVGEGSIVADGVDHPGSTGSLSPLLSVYLSDRVLYSPSTFFADVLPS